MGNTANMHPRILTTNEHNCVMEHLLTEILRQMQFQFVPLEIEKEEFFFLSRK